MTKIDVRAERKDRQQDGLRSVEAGAARGTGKEGERALSVVLEHIPRAAFVCDQSGAIIRANTVGKRARAEDEASWDARLASAVCGEVDSSGISVSRISVPGEGARFLVVARSGPDPVAAALAIARARWGITEREHAVLTRVAAGMSNRDVASQLGIAPRTVELRVTSLLRKAKVESRAQLIVALWELSEERAS